jgi:dCMP deaminase
MAHAYRPQPWEKRFYELAEHIALWSKDTSRKIGCVIVGKSREIVTTGFNGFPRGVEESITDRHLRPEKYLWTEHAERNAIYNAARLGVKVENCTMYSTLFPCMDCARAIIQSGISVLVAKKPDLSDPKYGEEFRKAIIMLGEAGVLVSWYQE